MKLWLNRLSILLDRPLWGQVYALFNLARDHEELRVDLAALPEKAKAAKEKLRSKMKARSTRLIGVRHSFSLAGAVWTGRVVPSGRSVD